MNVVCVYSVGYYASSKKPLATQGEIHFGVAAIASALKEAGFNVELMVITPETNIHKLLVDYFLEKSPVTKLFCLTAVSTQFDKMCEVAKIIKELNSNIHINLGGVHVTLNPESSLKCKYLDSICVGEGDKAIVELAKELKSGTRPSLINNLWFRLPSGQELIERNHQDPFIEDLDSLPIIDRKMWYPFIKDLTTMPALLVGRGCPNKCAYCSNHKLREVATGKYVRFRSPGSIIKEIEEMITDYPGIKSIYLEVETLSVNLPYAFELCRALENFNHLREPEVEFRVNLSLHRNIVNNEEFALALFKANVTVVNIGLESGSEWIRDSVLRRPKYTNSELVSFCALLRKFGIKTSLYIIMGLPTETHGNFLETLKCVKDCAPDSVQYGFFYPYPGTDLYTPWENSRSLLLFDHRFERKRPLINSTQFSKKEQQVEYVLLPWKLYKGKLPISNIMLQMLKNFVVQSDILTAIFMRVRAVL